MRSARISLADSPGQQHCRDAQDYASWYEPVSPRNEFMQFLERLGLPYQV